MTDTAPDWQNSLDRKLVNRLALPLDRSRITSKKISQQIIARSDRFLNRLPLLNQQMQRWGNAQWQSSDLTPIVYAQPIALENPLVAETKEQKFAPVTNNNSSLPLVQRKADPTLATPSIVDSTNTNSNSTERTTTLPASEDFWDRTTIFPIVTPQTSDRKIISSQISTEVADLSNQINDKSDRSTPHVSKTDIPLITPQNIAQESEITLNLSNSVPKKSDGNKLNPVSKSNTPVIDTQNIERELKTIPQMPTATVADLFDSRATKSDRNIPHVSKTDIPLVTPQNIAQELKTTSNLSNSVPKKSDRSNSNPVTKPNNSLPLVTPQPTSDRFKYARSIADADRQITDDVTKEQNNRQSITVVPLSISNTAENKNINDSAKTSSLTVVKVGSTINPAVQPQSLPLPLAQLPTAKTINNSPSYSQTDRRQIAEPTPSPPQIIARDSPPSQTYTSTMKFQPQVDANSIARQVERKIMRRLAIEKERRGK